MPYSFAGFCGVALCAMSAFGELGGNTDRLLLAELGPMATAEFVPARTVGASCHARAYFL